MHSRSLCPGNTEVHPALLSHRPVNLSPLTASPVSGSPPPPISSLPSSILTRPSCRCDLLISHVLMLSPPSARELWALALLRWPRARPLRSHLRVTAQPAWLLLRDAAPAPISEEWSNSMLPSPQLVSSCRSRCCCGHRLPPSPAQGWIHTCARCQPSSPSHQQPSPKKAKHRLCLHLSVHSQAVNADCRSPFHGSDSRKALQDGINPFCTGAEQMSPRRALAKVGHSPASQSCAGARGRTEPREGTHGLLCHRPAGSTELGSSGSASLPMSSFPGMDQNPRDGSEPKG